MSLRSAWAIILVRSRLKQTESWAQVIELLSGGASEALPLGYCALMFNVDSFCSFPSHKVVSSLPT